MAIRINLDVMLAKRKMSVTELSENRGIGKAFAIAICKVLDCQPGDILEYEE